MGPTDLKTLRTWGTELLVVDQSYYVPGFKGANIIWLAGDLTVDSEQDGHTEVKRRGFSEHGARVAQVLIDAYWSQANAAKSNLAAPYLSIYQVRAQAAYEARVTRKLVDRVIESLAKGNYAELGVDTTLHLGAADRWPPSEPIYNRGGRRRFQMTMCRTTRPEVSN